MEAPDLGGLSAQVAAWAKHQPLVLRAWIFGSRARGTARPDSDLDVAVEVGTLPGDSGPFVTFIFESTRMTRSLQRHIPVEVDFQWYGGPGETPIIHAGLLASSVLVYEKKMI